MGWDGMGPRKKEPKGEKVGIGPKALWGRDCHEEGRGRENGSRRWVKQRREGGMTAEIEKEPNSVRWAYTSRRECVRRKMELESNGQWREMDGG